MTKTELSCLCKLHIGQCITACFNTIPDTGSAAIGAFCKIPVLQLQIQCNTKKVTSDSRLVTAAFNIGSKKIFFCR